MHMQKRLLFQGLRSFRPTGPVRNYSFKIYTKSGDKGTSALYTGDRLNKDDEVFQCLGSIDEINANLGLAREHCRSIKNLDSNVNK